MNLHKKIYNIAQIISHDNIFVYSAQASFYIIISSIPFIMLLLSLAQYILPVSENDILKMVIPLMPEVIKSSVTAIINEIFYKASGSVISITAVSSVWSASRGIAAIERGTRNVYHTPTRSVFILDILASFFYTFSFILVMIVFLALFVFGNSIISFLELKSGILCWIFDKTSWSKWLLTFAVLTFLFALIYMAFSGRKIQLKRHIPGAVFTTSVWMIFSVLFSFYIENFANYSYLYGSLTAIVLMMLWVYFCMIIFLIGGEINVTVLICKLKKRNEQNPQTDGDTY
ncbi:MAG: YihY/virulence factor BrkB family protein [Clostridiales bacterium]|nr:YihY/virulence factor BrkB family protein [Clostridiales bacterium]